MLIENRFTVAAPADRVWAELQDLPGLVPCLPGAELTREVGDDRYEGRVVTRLGPVALRFSGVAELVEADESARRMVLHAAGSEDKGKGTAEMTMTMRLAAGSGGRTEVTVAQDLQVSGAAAQFGRGMIADVSGVLLRGFADCVEAKINGAGSGGTATVVRARPVGALGIAVSAALMALRRVVRRFLGPSTRPGHS
ncbi:SRPBCC family protein [Pseudonocardia sp. NPDC046786]|uniref:SRPBCC family protein n=1 Tax=Pseudonocardia sp. NPDC046786 TaxID=3155471 RepID=UPI0033DC5429